MMRRIWLISANKIKPFESIGEQSSQTHTQVIIVTDNCHISFGKRFSVLMITLFLFLCAH